jgi:hypothetical protein
MGDWAYILVAATPVVVAGAVEGLKPVIPANFIFIVGAIIGAIFTGLIASFIVEEWRFIAVFAMIGAFAPSWIADKVFEPLGLNRSG